MAFYDDTAFPFLDHIDDLSHFCDELITPSRNRRDIARLLRVFAECFAQSRDVNSQIDFLDETIRSDLLQQFVLRKNPARVAHKAKERVKNLRR